MAMNVSSRSLFTEDELRDMIALCVGPDRVPKRVRVITDTSDFFRVDYDDVVVLDGRPYLIRNHEKEGRFGVDEEPKFWVKRAIDLVDGSVKIMKLVFHEQFQARVGEVVFDCVRSPGKEARILDIVRSHPNFMQGFSVRDSAGNLVRIIDYIQGTKLSDSVLQTGNGHEEYFHTHFPRVFKEYIGLVKAIGFLHEHGEKHGDIRRDHVIRGSYDNVCRWIDFDFNYWHRENIFGYDIFGLGNILLYMAGRGDVTAQGLRQSDPDVFSRLGGDDMNIIFNNRVANLKKVYPYIPDSLNFVLLHFSSGADIFYDHTSQMLADLEEVRQTIT
jgi:hypothetical protein